MLEQSRFHFHITWAKERLDEMDAALAALERQAGEAQAASQAKTEQLIADLRKRRDEFEQAMNTRLHASETAWQRDRAQLERQWDGFAAAVNKHIEAFGRQAVAQQATFRDLAAAQLKAWHDAAERLHGTAAEFAGERRA